MLFLGIFSDVLAIASCSGVAFELPVAACYAKRASVSRLVSLWRILFEVSAKDWCGVERVSRLFIFDFLICLYLLFDDTCASRTNIVVEQSFSQESILTPVERLDCVWSKVNSTAKLFLK